MEVINGIPTYPEEKLYSQEISKTIGRDDFLKLFLAQLNYQDPLNPMQSQEFTAQLAQFSSVEQLFNVNDHLENIQTTQDTNAGFQALGFIGKEVVAEGNYIPLREGWTSTGGFVLEGTADCTVTITDGEGSPVGALHLGTLAPGEHTFQWDGRNESGTMQEPGVYRFTITAVDPGGQSLPVETRIQGRVDRVNLGAGSPLLYVGDIPLAISQVVDIKVPTTVGTGEDVPVEGDGESPDP